jgi:hypothetical protein
LRFWIKQSKIHPRLGTQQFITCNGVRGIFESKTMKKLSLPVTRLLLGLAGISAASLLTVQPSLAQLGTVDAGGNNDTQNNNIDFNSGNFNMFDLIHRANLGNGTFDMNRQNEAMDDAAKAFRERQNRAIGNQKQQGQILLTVPQNTNQPSANPSTQAVPGSN